MKPCNISQSKLWRNIDVFVGRINDIVIGDRGITADTALRLRRYFNTSPDLWLGIQAEYEIRICQAKMGTYLERKIQQYKECHK